ncbi:MAG TPA: hypothetical protein VGH24_12795 [Solirubrobacteraceae bacterium]|jgi:hypothetical protein
MSRPRFRALAVGVVAALSVLALPGAALAGGPGVWTKLADLDNVSATAGMFRTADGALHVVWLAKKAADGTHAYGTSTLSVAGKLLATGTALSGWATLEPDPQLFSDGSGMRLVFEGNTGASGCYFDGAIFTATSADGSTWNLVQGSLSSHTVGVGNIAATSETDGTTPVTTFAGGHLFHVGVDPSCPASSQDGTIAPTSGAFQSNPAIVTDPTTGAVWVAWYQSDARQGYWAEQILPTQAAPVEAPGSAATAGENNQPEEPVAIAARLGGGVYMAYCSATSRQPCAHIDLWKVGSPRASVVPGSQNTTGARVALTADPLGKLSVAWYNEAKNVIHSVRTNTTATAWGVVRTTRPPAHTSQLTVVQAQGSSGRLDVLTVDEPSTAGTPIGMFQTQILPGLSLSAKPGTFSHKKAAKVTFAVTDAGQPVAGARVSCLGKNGKTAASGTVKLKFHKGAAVGTHGCTAASFGYAVGQATLKVT